VPSHVETLDTGVSTATAEASHPERASFQSGEHGGKRHPLSLARWRVFFARPLDFWGEYRTPGTAGRASTPGRNWTAGCPRVRRLSGNARSSWCSGFSRYARSEWDAGSARNLSSRTAGRPRNSGRHWSARRYRRTPGGIRSARVTRTPGRSGRPPRSSRSPRGYGRCRPARRGWSRWTPGR